MTGHPAWFDSRPMPRRLANAYSFSQRFAGLTACKAIGFIQGIEPGLYFKK
jgi:hypothetical protein